MKHESLSFLIIDDHPVVLEGLSQILISQFPQARIDAAKNGSIAIQQSSKNRYDLTILDFSIGVENGLNVMEKIRFARPLSRFLFYSIHEDAMTIHLIMKSGASGYLSKAADPEDIVRAVKKVLDGQVFVQDELKDSLIMNIFMTGSKGGSDLSTRELEVLRHLGNGVTLKEAADIMCVSYSTVCTYKDRLIQKLGLSAFAELKKEAIKRVREGHPLSIVL